MRGRNRQGGEKDLTQRVLRHRGASWRSQGEHREGERDGEDTEGELTLAERTQREKRDGEDTEGELALAERAQRGGEQ